MKITRLYPLLSVFLSAQSTLGYNTCPVDHFKVVGQCKPCDLICPYQGVDWSGCKLHCPDMYRARNGGELTSPSPVPVPPAGGGHPPSVLHPSPEPPAGDHPPREPPPDRDPSSPVDRGRHDGPNNRHHPPSHDETDGDDLLSKDTLRIVLAIVITLLVAVVIFGLVAYWKSESFKDKVNALFSDCGETRRLQGQRHGSCGQHDGTQLTDGLIRFEEKADSMKNNADPGTIHNCLDEEESKHQLPDIGPIVEVHRSTTGSNSSHSMGSLDYCTGPRRRHEAGNMLEDTVSPLLSSNDMTLKRHCLQRQFSDPLEPTRAPTNMQPGDFGGRKRNLFIRQSSCPATWDYSTCMNTGVVGMETGQYTTCKGVTEKGSLPRLSTIIGSVIS